MIPDNTHLLCMGKYHLVTDLLLTSLGSIKQVNLLLVQHKKSSWIHTSKTGGQPYSDTFLYKIS